VQAELRRRKLEDLASILEDVQVGAPDGHTPAIPSLYHASIEWCGTGGVIVAYARVLDRGSSAVYAGLPPIQHLRRGIDSLEN
jgi:hypothetical protein